jgi:ADP-heptose:LPS heptosyltransferase
MLKRLLRKYGPNPLDSLLKKAKAKNYKTFLLFWNRGLGDIALGLYAIVHRIRQEIPDAEITFLTRPNLHDGFLLLEGVDIKIIPHLKRGDKVDVRNLIDPEKYDVIIENPDPTRWVSWQLGKLTPLLHWQEKWNPLCKKYNLDPDTKYIGAHVQTETNYASWRDWPISSWHALFEKITCGGKKVLLFGFSKEPLFTIPGVIDLRGETPLFDLLSIIKNHCEALVVPDSGVSSMVYFLNEDFSIKHISLWADPYMGILKQNVVSPNKLLRHIPILGKDKDITTITPEEVYGHLQ